MTDCQNTSNQGKLTSSVKEKAAETISKLSNLIVWQYCLQNIEDLNQAGKTNNINDYQVTLMLQIPLTTCTCTLCAVSQT